MQLEILCATCNDPFPIESIEDEFGIHYDPAFCPICGKHIIGVDENNIAVVEE